MKIVAAVAALLCLVPYQHFFATAADSTLAGVEQQADDASSLDKKKKNSLPKQLVEKVDFVFTVDAPKKLTEEENEIIADSVMKAFTVTNPGHLYQATDIEWEGDDFALDSLSVSSPTLGYSWRSRHFSMGLGCWLCYIGQEQEDESVGVTLDEEEDSLQGNKGRKYRAALKNWGDVTCKAIAASGSPRLKTIRGCGMNLPEGGVAMSGIDSDYDEYQANEALSLDKKKKNSLPKQLVEKVDFVFTVDAPKKLTEEENEIIAESVMKAFTVTNPGHLYQATSIEWESDDFALDSLSVSSPTLGSSWRRRHFSMDLDCWLCFIGQEQEDESAGVTLDEEEDSLHGNKGRKYRAALKNWGDVTCKAIAASSSPRLKTIRDCGMNLPEGGVAMSGIDSDSDYDEYQANEALSLDKKKKITPLPKYLFEKVDFVFTVDAPKKLTEEENEIIAESVMKAFTVTNPGHLYQATSIEWESDDFALDSLSVSSPTLGSSWRRRHFSMDLDCWLCYIGQEQDESAGVTLGEQEDSLRGNKGRKYRAALKNWGDVTCKAIAASGSPRLKTIRGCGMNLPEGGVAMSGIDSDYDEYHSDENAEGFWSSLLVSQRRA